MGKIELCQVGWNLYDDWDALTSEVSQKKKKSPVKMCKKIEKAWNDYIQHRVNCVECSNPDKKFEEYGSVAHEVCNDEARKNGRW